MSRSPHSFSGIPSPRRHNSDTDKGTQLLLLWTLVIVILGLVAVVGIQAYQENQKQINLEAMTTDVHRIALDAQAWARKPIHLGGGGSTFGVVHDRIGFDDLGYFPYELPLNGDEPIYFNENGGYALIWNSHIQATVIGCNSHYGNKVVAHIVGTHSEDIAISATTLSECESFSEP